MLRHGNILRDFRGRARAQHRDRHRRMGQGELDGSGLELGAVRAAQRLQTPRAGDERGIGVLVVERRPGARVARMPLL